MIDEYRGVESMRGLVSGQEIGGGGRGAERDGGEESGAGIGKE